MKPLTLSPSSLNLLADCPRCFWLYVIKKIKRPEFAFPSLPRGMDAVLKTHFDSFRDRNQLPPELKGKVKAELFKDKQLLEEWRSNFKGIKYHDSRSDIGLRGAVDNILQKDSKLIVLDYKTRGFALKEDTASHYELQMDVYNFLLRKNGYRTEDHAYLLFYHPKHVEKDGHVAFNVDLVKMPTDVSRAEVAFRKAVKILKGKEPKPSKECQFCNWKGC